MIKLDLNNEEYSLPTSFREVSISQYQKICAIPKDTKDTERLSQIISILTDIPNEIVKQISIDQIGFISQNIKYLFINEQYKYQQIIEIDGIKYAYDILDDMTFSKWIDLNYITDKDNLNDKLHLLMAILYRPIKKRTIKQRTLKQLIKSYINHEKLTYEYETENHEKDFFERSELFKEKMTMDIALGAMFFFIILKLAYIENMAGTKPKNQKELEEKILNRLKLMKIDT